MLCLLSPAKSLRESTASLVSTFRKSEVQKKIKVNVSKPLLDSESHVLVGEVQKLKKSQLKTLLGVSDSINDLNFKRYQDFDSQSEYIASFLYDGPAYKGLNALEMNAQDLACLDKSLCILSGLYGFVRPFDIIQPYRLDMGKKVQVEGCKNLYEFWKSHDITTSVAQLAQKNSASIVLNCASQEYSKVLDFDQLQSKHGLKVVHCVFKAHTGRLGSFFAKQARGMMVRYVATTGAKCLEDLHQFQGDGHYRFSNSDSDESSIVFLRYAEKPDKDQKSTTKKRKIDDLEKKPKTKPEKAVKPERLSKSATVENGAKSLRKSSRRSRSTKVNYKE
mmetsp:Transcript_8555/g.11114  ORF Transcript_8555/g.11114 Transcript_8555/m.11114 type:complete len:334 (+) Transcript_8555:158-1159(+)|eukprot:CAMPEP_0184008036 /NCGR_PEP_ID=MMETSP0954-20121128/1713_1 /TAXON_ID=627963 /ORGANISM="Aplanochytrium sp, Strain PBS07" /LENGTH=333 /DNA_ID=CAMNT_0026287027 /DNA_START=148 /DNA_END=1149 /DNA_ORIENTATION=+